MSLKKKSIEVLFEDGRILLPNNRWTPYHQLEHEYIHENSIDSIFRNTVDLDLSKWVSVLVDYGYGDIVCNLNYWLWLNEIRPIKIKILIDSTHEKKSFNNKESTKDKIEYLIHKQWQSNIEYKYVTIRRSFGNMLRTYKSAFRGKGLMKHTDKNYRRMWHKYVPVNLEQYWFTPLSMQLEWFPTKTQWVNPKEKSVVLYRYSPPKDWDLITNYSFANIGDKMISQDEKVVNKYWSDLEKALKKEKYSVEYLDYNMTPNQLFTKLSKATMLVSSRGGFSYLSQHIGTPTVTVFPPASMILNRDYTAQHVQFHNRSIKLFEPEHIAKVEIDELAKRNTLEKAKAMWKETVYNTLEKMQKLEKDVESFNSATSKVYREALRKDVNENPNEDLSKILPIIHDNRPARNIIQSKENEDWEGKTVKSSIKKALTKKPKKKSVKKTSGKKN